MRAVIKASITWLRWRKVLGRVLIGVDLVVILARRLVFAGLPRRQAEQFAGVVAPDVAGAGKVADAALKIGEARRIDEQHRGAQAGQRLDLFGNIAARGNRLVGRDGALVVAGCRLFGGDAEAGKHRVFAAAIGGDGFQRRDRFRVLVRRREVERGEEPVAGRLRLPSPANRSSRGSRRSPRRSGSPRRSQTGQIDPRASWPGRDECPRRLHGRYRSFHLVGATGRTAPGRRGGTLSPAPRCCKRHGEPAFRATARGIWHGRRIPAREQTGSSGVTHNADHAKLLQFGPKLAGYALFMVAVLV